MKTNLRVLIAQKEQRDGERYSYRKISLLTGLSSATLWKLTRPEGVKRIDSKTIEKLCNFFNCRVNDLLMNQER